MIKLYVDIVNAYRNDPFNASIADYCIYPSPDGSHKLAAPERARVGRYSVVDGLLLYQIDEHDALRKVIPTEDGVRANVIHKFQDGASAGHLGQEKTYFALARNNYWPHMNIWIRNWVRSCETCRCVKLSPANQEPQHPLPIATKV